VPASFRASLLRSSGTVLTQFISQTEDFIDWKGESLLLETQVPYEWAGEKLATY
jgi:hypothetical protein